MSKKGGPSLSPSKSALNPNTQTFNPSTIQWRTTFLPSVSHQLALPPTSAPPGLWTPIGAPITAGYGYGYPFSQPPPLGRYGPPPPVGPHSNYCCLANQRHQCGYEHNVNGWPSNGSNCWNNNNHSSDCHNNNSTTNGVAITEVKDDSKDESDDDFDNETKDKTNDNKSKKTIKELKQKNEELKTSLETTQKQLKETKEIVLKMKEQIPFECLEYYRKNLKNYGDYIRQECNRFYQNEEMAQKLKPIVEQLSEASHHIKKEKEKNRQTILTLRQKIKTNNNDCDLSANDFSPNSLPEFPDLLTFYKNILDEIPLIFLTDLSQLKRLTNNFIQTKKLSNNGLPMTSVMMPFGDDPTPSQKQLTAASNALFSPPNISDLPKPDFNTLPLKPVRVNTPTGLELNFPLNPSPIPMPDSITDEPMHSTILDIKPSNKNKEKPMSPIAKPLQPVIDLKSICAETVKNSQQNSLSLLSDSPSNRCQAAIESKLETDFIRAPINPIPKFAKAKPNPLTTIDGSFDGTFLAHNTTMDGSKHPLNQAQSKLLFKLREKYPQMTDVHLIDSMAQTKAVLIASGNPKGFSGMKVADIINKISNYIDSKVLSNNFSKPRLTEMKTSAHNEVETIGNKMANTSIAPPSKKAWNTMAHKTGKYDDSICSICFETISINTRYETECQHFFHHSCISNWIKTDGSCPICRHLVLPPGEFPEL